MNYEEEMRVVTALKNTLEMIRWTKPKHIPKTDEQKFDFIRTYFLSMKPASCEYATIWILKNEKPEIVEEYLKGTFENRIYDFLVMAELEMRNGKRISGTTSIGAFTERYTPLFTKDGIYLIPHTEVKMIKIEATKEKVEHAKHDIKLHAEYIYNKFRKEIFDAEKKRIRR